MATEALSEKKYVFEDLINAIVSHKIDTIVKIKEASSELFNTLNEFGGTLMHFAAESDHVGDVIRKINELFPEMITKKDDRGLTPELIAACNCNVTALKVIRELLSNQ